MRALAFLFMLLTRPTALIAQVSRFSSWNGPILATLFAAALTAVLYDDVRAIHALASYDDVMEVHANQPTSHCARPSPIT